MLNQVREKRMRDNGRVFVEKGMELNKLSLILKELSKKSGMDLDNISKLIQTREKYVSIPVELFKSKLSPLENVVYYLFVFHKFSQTEIAGLLRRDHTTIWTTLENATKKMQKARFIAFIEKTDTKLSVPVNIFAKDKLSILESLCSHLKENMTYHEIAVVLGKNDRTIWTVVNRAKKKII